MKKKKKNILSDSLEKKTMHIPLKGSPVFGPRGVECQYSHGQNETSLNIAPCVACHDQMFWCQGVD